VRYKLKPKNHLTTYNSRDRVFSLWEAIWGRTNIWPSKHNSRWYPTIICFQGTGKIGGHSKWTKTPEVSLSVNNIWGTKTQIKKVFVFINAYFFGAELSTDGRQACGMLDWTRQRSLLSNFMMDSLIIHMYYVQILRFWCPRSSTTHLMDTVYP
jgi:hypothetical protein